MYITKVYAVNETAVDAMKNYVKSEVKYKYPISNVNTKELTSNTHANV